MAEELVAGKTAAQWATWLDNINHIEGSYATSNGADIIRSLLRQLAQMTQERDKWRAGFHAEVARWQTRAEHAEAQVKELTKKLDEFTTNRVKNAE